MTKPIQKVSDIFFSLEKRRLRNLTLLKARIKKTKKEKKLRWKDISKHLKMDHCDLVRFCNNPEKGCRSERLLLIEEWLLKNEGNRKNTESTCDTGMGGG